MLEQTARGIDRYRIACIPTMPSRMNIVERSAMSIARQVDVLFIYCNNGAKLPESLRSIKNVVPVENEPDRGSAGRFMICGMRGYLFFCDDDLVYPEHYCDIMIETIEKYDRRAVVSMHGRNIDLPMISYQGMGRGRNLEIHACRKEVLRDAEVMMVGTGVMAYHWSTLDGLLLKDIIHNNLDDVEFSIRCHERLTPMVVAKHGAGTFEYLEPTGMTIWGETVKNNKPLLAMINSFKGWRKYGLQAS